MDERPPQDVGFTVLVLADPGQCVDRARAAQGRFEEELAAVFGAATVHVRTQFLGISDSNTLALAPVDAVRGDYEHVDMTLLLTEMPRRADKRALIAELLPDREVATLSLPTIGVLSGRERLVTVFMACVMQRGDALTEQDRARYSLRWSRWSETSDRHGAHLRSSTVIGSIRTVLGMVATNAPWRAAPKLSSALAAASATGAFGIFYNSIWQMSAALSTPRLLLIGLLAMTSMVLWLIVGNRLWERPMRDDATTVLLYSNLSTVLTLFLCVLSLYVALVVLILGGSLVVIDPDFMSGVLGELATFARYVDIAWLSAALGVVAGGLGASFDDSTDLRQLTHGSRESLRRPSRDAQG